MNEKKERIFTGKNRMFHILVCDDEVPTCSFIEQAILKYGKKKKLEIETECCYTAKGLLQYIKENRDLDILFLDIELPDKNGAEVGRIIRDELKIESVQIVFISSQEKYAMRLFQVRPFDFLIKPLSNEKIIQIFEKYRKLYENDHKFFEYTLGRHDEKTLLSEIMYFKCDYRKILMVTNEKKVSYYGSMKSLHKSLQVPEFWSVHNSYIVNIRYVKQFKESEIIMTDNTVIPISQAYKSIVKKKTMELSLNEDVI